MPTTAEIRCLGCGVEVECWPGFEPMSVVCPECGACRWEYIARPDPEMACLSHSLQMIVVLGYVPLFSKVWYMLHSVPIEDIHPLQSAADECCRRLVG